MPICIKYVFYKEVFATIINYEAMSDDEIDSIIDKLCKNEEEERAKYYKSLTLEQQQRYDDVLKNLNDAVCDLSIPKTTRHKSIYKKLGCSKCDI